MFDSFVPGELYQDIDRLLDHYLQHGDRMALKNFLEGL